MWELLEWAFLAAIVFAAVGLAVIITLAIDGKDSK